MAAKYLLSIIEQRGPFSRATVSERTTVPKGKLLTARRRTGEQGGELRPRDSLVGVSSRRPRTLQQLDSDWGVGVWRDLQGRPTGQAKEGLYRRGMKDGENEPLWTDIRVWASRRAGPVFACLSHRPLRHQL